MPKSQSLRWIAAAAFLGASSAAVSATESASSVYLPGQKAALAGLTPPPGLFLSNDWYFYEGSAGSTTGLPFGGEIVFDADIQLILDVPTAIWITKAEILGGRLGFAASFPIVHADLNATVN
jgi:hypothetical protein